MYANFDPTNVAKRLEMMIGEPYEWPDGCMQFVKRALFEFGVKVEAINGSGFRDGRLFGRVASPKLGTVVVWRDMPFPYSDKYHVGIMLDKRWALQSSMATNGVGRVEITRYPFSHAPAVFYHPKSLS